MDLGGEAVAYPYSAMQMVRVVNDTVGGRPIVAFWTPGAASALDAGTVAAGDDVGSVTTFSRLLDGDVRTFVYDGQRIVDQATVSEWNALGVAVTGPLATKALDPVISVNHFWFSWAAFKPDTRVFEEDISSYAMPTPLPPRASGAASELEGDFQIDAYQGQDVLGGQVVPFSKAFSHGKPVILSLWAGLCPICRTEMPELEEVHREYGNQLLVVGVDIGPFVGLGDEDDGRALLEELGITYPAGSTPDRDMLRDYQVLGTPTTIFIKPNGEVLDEWTGLLTRPRMIEKVEALLDASKR